MPKIVGLDFFTALDTRQVHEEKIEMLETIKHKQYSRYQSEYDLQD